MCRSPDNCESVYALLPAEQPRPAAPPRYRSIHDPLALSGALPRRAAATMGRALGESAEQPDGDAFEYFLQVQSPSFLLE